MVNIIAALLNERHGYLVRSRHDRVKMVDDMLAELGYVGDVENASIDVDVETATRKKSVKRKKG